MAVRHVRATQTMAELSIERLGGLAGIGMPGARMVSRGRVDLSALAQHERDAVDVLFSAAAQSRHRESPVPDGFRYRITRPNDAGGETVEVPESQVPAALIKCVKDELL